MLKLYIPPPDAIDPEIQAIFDNAFKSAIDATGKPPEYIAECFGTLAAQDNP